MSAVEKESVIPFPQKSARQQQAELTSRLRMEFQKTFTVGNPFTALDVDEHARKFFPDYPPLDSPKLADARRNYLSRVKFPLKDRKEGKIPWPVFNYDIMKYEMKLKPLAAQTLNTAIIRSERNGTDPAAIKLMRAMHEFVEYVDMKFRRIEELEATLQRVTAALKPTTKIEEQK